MFILTEYKYKYIYGNTFKYKYANSYVAEDAVKAWLDVVEYENRTDICSVNIYCYFAMKINVKYNYHFFLSFVINNQDECNEF